MTSGTALDLVDVRLPRALVNRREESIDLGLLRQPCCHPAELLAEAVDSLNVHISLGDKLGH